MFYPRYFRLTTALLSLITSAAAFDINAKTNVAIYYGQGPNEAVLGLKDFCTNSNVDIIPLGFLDIYPAQGNGYPGTNFASSCTGTVFSGPGYNGNDDHTKDDLQNDCPTLVDGIGFCQAQGKKILLSLGGAPAATKYQLTSTSDAEYLADFLWGAFGPLQPGNTWPRPFDDVATGSHSVDGFDFDIEVIQPGEQQYYITMINRLISYFPTGPGAKKYLITGAPQCIVPDNQMGDMITGVPFDILFVQYYNTDACSARSWITANPNYPSVPETTSGFGLEFFELLNFLKGGASANAKIYFGLPGATAAANAGEYLTIPEATKFLEAYFCQPSFGGVMVWEGIYAYDNIINGQNYQNNIKSILTADSSDPTLSKCPATTPTYTTTSATPTATACVTCTKPYSIVSGDTCYDLWTNNGIPSDTFYSLNPGINCNNLQIGQVICLGGSVGSCTTTSTTTTPTPTACPTCTSTHTIVGGDLCSDLWTSNGISSTLFYALNPGINCNNLQIGQVVCVGGTVGPCTTTTTTTSTSSSTTPTATACPTCTSTHSVVSGDDCYDLWTNNGISSTLFYALNPNIDCGDLQLDQIVCVGGSVGACTTTTTSSTTSTTSSTSSSTTPTATACPTCTSTHSVVSGDDCYDLWTNNGISSTLFYALNPSINCGNLQLGQIVCVGGTVGPCTTSTTQSTTSTTSSTQSTTSSTQSTGSTSSTHSTTSSTHPTNSTTSSTHSTSSTHPTISPTHPTTGSNNSTHSPPTTEPTHLHSNPGPSGHSHSYTSYRNSSSHAHHASTTVTHTITTTSVYTITSCAPTVTKCHIGQVTTDTLTITTTYCPGGAAHPPKITAKPIKYTTSVVYTTLTYTITACPPTVKNCPARGSVTTETKALYTTICPVAEITTPVVIPASTAPGAPAKEVSVSTVSYASETAVVPKLSSSSFAVVYQTLSVLPVASTSPSGAIVASASPVQPNTATFTGSATHMASLGSRGVMTVILCMIGWALM